MRLGENIKEVQERRGIAVAKLADRAKISSTALRKIMNGKTQEPGVFVIARIAAALDVPIEELIGGTK